MVYEMVSQDANIILGSVIDDNMDEDIMVTVIATGFENVPAETKEVKTFAASTLEKLEKTEEKKVIPRPNIHSVNDIVYQGQAQFTAQEQSQEQVKAQASQVSQVSPVSQASQVLDQAQEKKLYTAPILDNSNDSVNLDLNDLDTPTFLRKKAEQDAQIKQVHTHLE